MFNYTVLYFLVCLICIIATPKSVVGRTDDSYSASKKLLQLMDMAESRGHDSTALAKLFSNGDNIIEDLIKALNDKDSRIQTTAQRVIRYLGNKQGLDYLYSEYLVKKRTKEYIPFCPPIPIPLKEWDYDYINKYFLSLPIDYSVFEFDAYAFALLLDDSEKASSTLEKWIRFSKENELNGDPFLEMLKLNKPRDFIPAESVNDKGFVKYAFFLDQDTKTRSSAQVLAYNSLRNKVLIELKVGILFATRYHVVLEKKEKGWKFFSITLMSFH